MKHTRTITRQPIVAQSSLEIKLVFMVDLIGQAGDFLGVALDIATTLLDSLLHFPVGGTTA